MPRTVHFLIRKPGGQLGRGELRTFSLQRHRYPVPPNKAEKRLALFLYNSLRPEVKRNSAHFPHPDGRIRTQKGEVMLTQRGRLRGESTDAEELDLQNGPAVSSSAGLHLSSRPSGEASARKVWPIPPLHFTMTDSDFPTSGIQRGAPEQTMDALTSMADEARGRGHGKEVEKWQKRNS